MALIKCPECNKDVSDKASACPHCGFPINKSSIENIKHEEIKGLIFPSFPNDMPVGSHVIDNLPGFIDSTENFVKSVPSGNVYLSLRDKGITILSASFAPIMDIHFLQIIGFQQTGEQEIMRIDKSVIGRAVVGTLIFGPLGTIVGAISGVGSRTETISRPYLIISYWDMTTKEPVSILIRSKQNAAYFMTEYEKQKKEFEGLKPYCEKVWSGSMENYFCDECSKSILVAKDTMNCPICGKSFPVLGTYFCEVCYKFVSISKNQKNCSSCKTPVPVYCMELGKNM